MRAIVFHNPKSGQKGFSKEDILAAMKLADYSARYVSTKSDEFKDVVEKAAGDFVVVAGGDGTVAEVIARLGDRKLPIGILPMGTANNIARSLGIGGEPQVLVESWKFERTRRLDVVRSDGPGKPATFVEAFGIGILPAMFLKAAKRDKEKGPHSLASGREMLRKVIADAKPIDIRVMIDGKTLDGEFIGVEVLNIPFTGPGLALAPKADFADGLLDFVGFAKDKRGELSQWLEAPAGAPLPAFTRRGKMVTLMWRNAPYRLDDESHEADGAENVVTLACEDEQARILEAQLSSQAASKAESAA